MTDVLAEILKGVLHTIPLLSEFPGRPKSIFFSSSFFLGGILPFRLAKDRLEIKGKLFKGEINFDLAMVPTAVLAADR